MGCGFRLGRLLMDLENWSSYRLPDARYGGHGHHYRDNYDDYQERFHADDRNRAQNRSVEDIMRRELDTLYANGALTREEYQDARRAMDAGRFTLDNLWELRQRAERSSVQARRDDDDLGKTVAQLETKERELSEARERTEKVWKELSLSIEDLKKQIKRNEELAQMALSSDEQQARRYLTQRMELAEQSAGLEGRAQELAEELERLDALGQRIRARIAEVTALRHRERLALLEAEVLNLPGFSNDR